MHLTVLYNFVLLLTISPYNGLTYGPYQGKSTILAKSKNVHKLAFSRLHSLGSVAVFFQLVLALSSLVLHSCPASCRVSITAFLLNQNYTNQKTLNGLSLTSSVSGFLFFFVDFSVAVTSFTCSLFCWTTWKYRRMSTCFFRDILIWMILNIPKVSVGTAQSG